MRLTARRTAILVLLFTPLTTLAAAQHRASSADRTLSPYFLIENGDAGLDQLPLKDTRVDVAIAGVIADVTVRQVYENRGSRPLNARYVFPASTRAAVYGMTMTVGDRRITARIREREQAQQEFDAAKREGKNASLLEQSRPNVFTMNVANVHPGDVISVELKYTELLVPTDGAYEFVYPTVVGPRYSSKRESLAPAHDRFVQTAYLREGELPKSEFHLTGVISTAVPIQTLDSPSHEIRVRSTGPGRAELVLEDAERAGGSRDFVLRYSLAGRTISSGLLLFEGKDENFFLLMAEPPQAITSGDLPPREYVFVVDVSGSMHGFPLDTAKTLMSDLAKVLRPSDTFNVVVFADGTETFAPVSVPATRPNLVRALEFIGQKDGGGGTELLAALRRAADIQRTPGTSRSIVLLTDGYIEAEADVFDYIRGQLNQTNVFAFGIGSSVNRYLIEGVARAGLGEPFVVTEPASAAAAASSLRRYIESPVLTGIQLRVAGFDAYDVQPGRIPDLFASRPIVVFGKWRGDVGGTIDVSGTTGGGRYQASIPVTRALVDDGHAALRHLWARSRIAELSDFGALEPDDERVAEIRSLGLTYGLLTRYTSFIAVHELVRAVNDAGDVDQPLPLPQGVSELAVGVTRGSEPELIWIAVAAGMLFAAVLVMRRRQPSGDLA